MERGKTSHAGRLRESSLRCRVIQPFRKELKKARLHSFSNLAPVVCPLVNFEYVRNTSVSQSLREQCRTDSDVRKLFLLPVIEEYSPEFQKVLFVITDTYSSASLPQESPISHDLASVRKSSDTLANTLLL
jgi:hypothetical protein